MKEDVYTDPAKEPPDKWLVEFSAGLVARDVRYSLVSTKLHNDLPKITSSSSALLIGLRCRLPSVVGGKRLTQ